MHSKLTFTPLDSKLKLEKKQMYFKQLMTIHNWWISLFILLLFDVTSLILIVLLVNLCMHLHFGHSQMHYKGSIECEIVLTKNRHIQINGYDSIENMFVFGTFWLDMIKNML